MSFSGLGIINNDCFRVLGKEIGIINFFKAYRNQGFRYLFFLRINRYAKRNIILGTISKIMLRHYVYKFGFQIPSKTEIGGGLYISHFGTIVINGDAKIGKNCNITHNVTIGKQNRGEKAGAPIIGDFVWIGTGSVIVGKITIGDHVLIAPNSYVNFDVPSHSIVIGNPGRVISRNYPTEGYINNIPKF